MGKFLMACGHVSNATKDGKPVCAICYGKCGSDVALYECVGDTGLWGRKAKCRDCGHKTDSKWNLAFFEYCPDKDNDTYYDGCYGW